MSGDWQAVRQAVAEQHGPWIAATLAAIAEQAWGRAPYLGWDPAIPAWRAYLYLGSVEDSDHRYLELGAAATIAPDGTLVALQLDDGRDFVVLADPAEHTLRLGLGQLVGRGLPQISHAEPAYPHRVRPYGAPAYARLGGWLRRLLGR
jgi:hypothetical protein